MRDNGPRLAVNPIAYWLAGDTPDRTTRTLGPAFTELADIGYTAVKADVPDDMAAEDYLPWLASFGLEPAVSLYSGAFADRDTHGEQAAAARVFAARQAAFGQRFCMISTIEPPGSPRRDHPAVGHGFDPDRLEVVVEGIALCCAAMRDAGVTAALHPHVGGWVETEHELRAVLDGVGPDLLAFGPDTGHMAWAGMDVPAVLRDYADRIVGAHLKDTFATGIARAKADDLDYTTATEPGRIWAEPGRGDVDLTACIAAFPAGFAGDYMIEVDVPSLPLRECHQVAYDWALATLPAGRPVVTPLRVAVVGCGDIAAVHLAAILEAATTGTDGGVELVGVCDIDEGRRAEAAAHGNCPAFADLTAMLDGVAPDVVHVCTPHHRHADLAAQCLARDVSVLLEKPVAHTLDDGERLAVVAEDSTAVLGVCFQNRYNDTARMLREMLDSGGLGRVLGARASVTWFRDAAYYTRRDWRGRWSTAGGGVLMNQAIHTLDLLQWFVGPVTDVRGTIATLALPDVIEVEDTAALRLRHRTAAGDAVGSVFFATNGHVENAPATLEIITEHARLRLDTDLTVTHDDGRVETFHPATVASGERAYWGASHGLLIDDFYRHVRAGKRFWIDAPAALESLRVIQAAYDQSRG